MGSRADLSRLAQRAVECGRRFFGWAGRGRCAGSRSSQHISKILTASASPSTATSYRPLTASKRPATPHCPLSSGRAWRPPMRTRRPERLGVGAAVVADAEAACCRSSLAMAAWPLASVSPSAVSPSWSRSSVLAPAASSSCTHSWCPS
eukprot:scaffold77959_cov64-Phaeocystis_antarctica.AAC.5